MEKQTIFSGGNVAGWAVGLVTLGVGGYFVNKYIQDLKAKKEVRISSFFKAAPVEFLRMIVVHELVHLKEKNHDKAFYQLCQHIEPEYHQLEFDCRVYLLWKNS